MALGAACYVDECVKTNYYHTYLLFDLMFCFHVAFYTCSMFYAPLYNKNDVQKKNKRKKTYRDVMLRRVLVSR